MFCPRNTQSVTSGVKILSFQHVPIAVSACETTSAEHIREWQAYPEETVVAKSSDADPSLGKMPCPWASLPMMGVRIRAVLNWHPRARECLKHAARNREQLIASNCNEVHSFQVRATGVELPSVSRESRFSRLQLRHQSASGSIRPKRAITSTLNVETEGASLAVRIRES